MSEHSITITTTLGSGVLQVRCECDWSNTYFEPLTSITVEKIDADHYIEAYEVG